VSVEEETPRADTPLSVRRVNSISKAKKSKKKDPPLLEHRSTADVLYQEIRTLLGGEAVVDCVTEGGGAFKSPHSFGEETVVKVDLFGSGGASFFP